MLNPKRARGKLKLTKRQILRAYGHNENNYAGFSWRDCSELSRRLQGDSAEELFTYMNIGSLQKILAKRLKDKEFSGCTHWLLDFFGGFISKNRVKREYEIAGLEKLELAGSEFDSRIENINASIELARLRQGK